MLARILIFLVRGYQVAVSPLLPPSCRFAPSCSDYMLTAVRRFGPFRGGWLGLRRMCRCHPWGGCGFDPVPPQQEPRKETVAQSAPPATTRTLL